MDEYIKRQSALDLLWKDGRITTDGIKAIPAADVAPVVHGRWKHYKKQGIAVCTCCSFERNLDDDFGRAVNCPNCGAKMDKEDK